LEQKLINPTRVSSFFNIHFIILLPAITNGLSHSRLRTNILLKSFIRSQQSAVRFSCSYYDPITQFSKLQFLFLYFVSHAVMSFPASKVTPVIPRESLILFLFSFTHCLYLVALSEKQVLKVNMYSIICSAKS